MNEKLIGTFEIEEVDESHRWQATLAALTGLMSNHTLNSLDARETAAYAIEIGRIVAEKFSMMEEQV